MKLTAGAVWFSGCRAATPPPSPTSPRGKVRAVAFDLFTLFDPRDVDRSVEQLLPAASVQRGFAAAWKARLFQYSWIRTASGRYVDFEQLVQDSLDSTCRAHGVVLALERRRQLEASFTRLTAWPDTREVLESLRANGLRLAPLANFSPRMITTLLEQAGMHHYFDAIISTDRAKTYKPDPRAYALGEQVLGLPRRQIAFSAFGGWDAAGARWFGYPTFWVNRLGGVQEQLTAPDATGPNLRHLARWLAKT